MILVVMPLQPNSVARDFVSPQTGDVVAESGSKLPGTPENVLSASLDGTWSIGANWDMIGSVSAYYKDESEGYINQDSLLNETFDAGCFISIRHFGILGFCGLFTPPKKRGCFNGQPLKP